ncbi:MarR family winged helix-turn-helix transcriptional regulator [Pseudonocardia cypriaca]|uniref:DNA-binding MarR family transcriptional regulator n=1 Tax=Pseudonocardia cypriaca TaxID=882449 RepID=A0A543GIA3_9PSEU|nr:MarR family transcriptional regulator [Pseudonocardia cypriaca]TQM45818.1 DNA-binding MarR family transcriptional regulator [Pseudonocardia cypriaca]
MSEQRHDLGAAFAWLARAMIKAEEPLLRAHDVEMWDYVILATLARGPASTQSELAAASGRDKTRLIPILDRLEARGLLRRTPDPADRRNRVVALTEDGLALLGSCRAAIREMEAEFLADLEPGERATFVAVLERLADSVRDR